MRRSWKGYPFDILNLLTDEEFICGSKQAKSTYLTEKGIQEAKKLAEIYEISEEDF